MEPIFKAGEHVIINRLAYLFSQPRLEDTVAVRHRDKILLKKIKKVISRSQYFVIGLNKTNSTDSRTFGPIEKNQIVGKVLTKY